MNPSTALRTRVKICGIKNLSEARASIELGADYLGFNFVTTSIRFVDKNLAKKIIDETDKKKTKIFGVFQNESQNNIYKLADFLNLDYVQIHENLTTKFPKEIRAKIINRQSMVTDFYLIDRKIQGEGESVNLEKAKIIASKYPIFLAGGLNAENVAGAIRAVRPYAVDVAGGVETNGKKDLLKIEKFIKAAKSL